MSRRLGRLRRRRHGCVERSLKISTGISALAEVLSRTGDGIGIIDAEWRYRYANTAICRILGRTVDELLGEDFLDSFGPAERKWVSSRMPGQFGDSRPPFFCVLRDAAGNEREIVCATFILDMPEDPHCIVIFREMTGAGVAARTAGALVQAARLRGTGTTEQILSGIARLAVEGSRALAAGIVAVGHDHTLTAGGSHGFPANTVSRQVWTAAAITLEDLPGADALLTNNVVVLPEARAEWEASPVMKQFVATLGGLDWRAVVLVPLSWEGELQGVFAAYLKSAKTGAGAADLAFYQALADQAAVVVTNARLTASLERTRLARELHDSVSQALFSMTMHARAAQLSLEKSDVEATAPVSRAVDQLVELTKGALAEMRALIFELRPRALAEEGLVAALGKQGAAVAAREQVAVIVHGPERRLGLSAEVEEHLYRIATEALHNVIKHAGATTATVTVTDQAGLLQLVVSDDGSGFDPHLRRAGHLGLSTMARRAEMSGAEFSVTSTPHVGTVVKVSLPGTRPDGSREV